MNSRYIWLHKLLVRLEKSSIVVSELKSVAGPLRSFSVNAHDWGRCAPYLHEHELRFAALWAEDQGEYFVLHACLEKQGDYLLLITRLSRLRAEISSWSSIYAGANRLERHTQDMFGIHFSDSPDQRRWTRHQAWPETWHPLLKNQTTSDAIVQNSPADVNYPFHRVDGKALYEIPVGPVHAGIIEPGHFRFHALGETVINLEIRLGYLHKGIEKLAEGQDIQSLLQLAARVSGDSTVAHSWAAAQAAEYCAAMEIPERALHLRAVLCERERIANHLGDIGAICNDVGFSFGAMQFSRLRENILRHNAQWFGHRLLMDQIIAGGVRHDIGKEVPDVMREECRQLRTELAALMSILRDTQSLRDRLYGTGVLSADHARQLGCLGYVARASGVRFDLRADRAYAPYEHLAVEHPLQQTGDVAARVLQRAEESFASLNIIGQLLDHLPHGPIATAWKTPSAGSSGVGIIEGWRGEIISFIRFGNDGKIERYFPRDPSWFNWLALPILIDGNIVPDFPVCNKSINASYSGVDL